MGCVSPRPLNEFTLARTAVDSAKGAGAENFAAGLWYQAQSQFRLGQQALKDKDNESAKKHFASAVRLAEKAENAARLKKFETGETF